MGLVTAYFVTYAWIIWSLIWPGVDAQELSESTRIGVIIGSVIGGTAIIILVVVIICLCKPPKEKTKHKHHYSQYETKERSARHHQDEVGVVPPGVWTTNPSMYASLPMPSHQPHSKYAMNGHVTRPLQVEIGRAPWYQRTARQARSFFKKAPTVFQVEKQVPEKPRNTVEAKWEAYRSQNTRGKDTHTLTRDGAVVNKRGKDTHTLTRDGAVVNKRGKDTHTLTRDGAVMNGTYRTGEVNQQKQVVQEAVIKPGERSWTTAKVFVDYPTSNMSSEDESENDEHLSSFRSRMFDDYNNPSDIVHGRRNSESKGSTQFRSSFRSIQEEPEDPYTARILIQENDTREDDKEDRFGFMRSSPSLRKNRPPRSSRPVKRTQSNIEVTRTPGRVLNKGGIGGGQFYDYRMGTPGGQKYSQSPIWGGVILRSPSDADAYGNSQNRRTLDKVNSQKAKQYNEEFAEIRRVNSKRQSWRSDDESSPIRRERSSSRGRRSVSDEVSPGSRSTMDNFRVHTNRHIVGGKENSNHIQRERSFNRGRPVSNEVRYDSGNITNRRHSDRHHHSSDNESSHIRREKPVRERRPVSDEVRHTSGIAGYSYGLHSNSYDHKSGSPDIRREKPLTRQLRPVSDEVRLRNDVNRVNPKRQSRDFKKDFSYNNHREKSFTRQGKSDTNHVNHISENHLIYRIDSQQNKENSEDVGHTSREASPVPSPRRSRTRLPSQNVDIIRNNPLSPKFSPSPKSRRINPQYSPPTKMTSPVEKKDGWPIPPKRRYRNLPGKDANYRSKSPDRNEKPDKNKENKEKEKTEKKRREKDVTRIERSKSTKVERTADKSDERKIHEKRSKLYSKQNHHDAKRVVESKTKQKVERSSDHPVEVEIISQTKKAIQVEHYGAKDNPDVLYAAPNKVRNREPSKPVRNGGSRSIPVRALTTSPPPKEIELWINPESSSGVDVNKHRPEVVIENSPRRPSNISVLTETHYASKENEIALCAFDFLDDSDTPDTLSGQQYTELGFESLDKDKTVRSRDQDESTMKQSHFDSLGKMEGNKITTDAFKFLDELEDATSLGEER